MFGLLSRRLHVSWLVAWFAAAIIIGIALSFFFKLPFIGGGPLITTCSALLLITFIKRTCVSIVLVIFAGLLIGLWRGENVHGQTAVYKDYIGRSVTISGVVADDVTHKNGLLGIKLNNISINDIAVGGQVWAGSDSNIDLKRGDRVSLSGKLSAGFGAFAASIDKATLIKISGPDHPDWTREIRDNFASGLRKAVPEPEATLGLGYLTGQHNELPNTLIKQLQLVGLIHLVIAGGYNVTILVRFARRRFAKISKYFALLAASSILFCITLMAGFTAPMARTAIVTGLSLWAWYYGRRIHPLVLLPAAAAITAVIDPAFVWGDVGWYMTFVAYGGLIILAPMLKDIFWDDDKHSELRQIFIDTLSVQLVTMPIMAFAFGQYSIYGLPANLLVLPLMSFTMLFTFTAGLAGMLLPLSLSHIIGWPASFLLTYTEKITTLLANANGADATASYTAIMMVSSYLAIFIVVWVMLQKTKLNFRAVNVIE